MADTKSDAPRETVLPKDRPPRPERGTPWRHQDGCTNPESTDWDCPCGPEVIKG